ncbi:response regulator [Paenibacillus sp. YAF4_2]|uniref:response regulator n=1 Tax=Paenibacillus sp. YAF4_2 TaxID=3233085 RepID=UPI003F9708C9
MKVIIVDDETAIHEQLIKMIPWDELGWEIVGHAYNGEEARQLTELLRPNLILTDIRMPLMDGLGFMEWLKSSGQQAKVIVLSGYGDFEYSRTAFKLDAYDYLLKPVQEAELLTVLGKAVEQIQQDSKKQSDRINEKAVLNQGLTLMQDEFFTQAAGSSHLEENELYVRAEQLMIDLPQGGYSVVAVKFIAAEENVQERYKGDRSVFYFAARNIMQETLGGIPVFRYLHKTAEFVFLYSHSSKHAGVFPQLLSRLHHSLEICLRTHARIGVSSTKQRISKLSAAYTEAVQALESLHFGNEEDIAYYGKQANAKITDNGSASGNWKEIGLLLDMLLGTGAIRDGEVLLAKLEEAFCEQSVSVMSGAEWKKASSELLDKLESHMNDEDSIMLMNEARAGIRELRTGQVKESLRRLIESRLQSAAGETKTKNGKQLIEVVKKYIDIHYKSISLEEVSARFYLNKNYFCSLFKSVSGESFVEYVTALRMEHAKRLLMTSELKAYEVAEMVGYSDQRYFSQVFRKATGMKPTEYRQSQS